MKCRKCLKDYEPRIYELKKHDYMCHQCRKEDQAKWREERRAKGLPSSGSNTWDPEKKRAYLKRWKNDTAVKKRNAERMREYCKNPEVKRRNMARWAVSHQKESGKITNEPCAFCGKQNTEAHHPDYDKPLLIVWLCGDCHRKIHPRSKNKIRSLGHGHISKWIDDIHHCGKNKHLRKGILLESGKYRCGLCWKTSPKAAGG